VGVVCCHVEVSATTRKEESYRLWCVVVCDLETSRMRRPWPALGRSAIGKKISEVLVYGYPDVAICTGVLISP